MSAKAIFRLSLMVGALAALALGAVADAPNSVADDGAPPLPNSAKFDETDPAGFVLDFPREDKGAGVSSPPFADSVSPPDAVADGGAGFGSPLSPAPFADSVSPDAAPSAVSDDLSPGVFGKKAAQTYRNLTGALDGIAGVAAANLGRGEEG